MSHCFVSPWAVQCRLAVIEGQRIPSQKSVRIGRLSRYLTPAATGSCHIKRRVLSLNYTQSTTNMRAVLKAALATSICVYGVQASSQHNLHSGQHPLTGQQKFGTDEFKVAIIGAADYRRCWVFRCILAITSKVKIGREYNDNDI
ncbi:hypothetical protein AG1IA_10085 [Rhizoctonia solani AG-1 IA]|uniref:Uncharacterized protein n=1 Tax=Thanatephorus cucumeris (strain AG1-IA) TaxID=983506 RepID=L8WD53_THACA|nr:hypothetical protein AG1IA_10085 [Rhizoctonia solani AG-1 IA]